MTVKTEGSETLGALTPLTLACQGDGVWALLLLASALATHPLPGAKAVNVKRYYTIPFSVLGCFSGNLLLLNHLALFGLALGQQSTPVQPSWPLN